MLDDRYRIVGRLGRGGMGEVYRADDLRLAQPVALKFLPPDVDSDPARLTQLHGEVRMARQVSHPNVCRVYDIGEFEGHTFLSMEYVDGEDLASVLRRIGRLPQDRAIELARQMCAGLAAAHDRGVVHRDLKPANIMLDGTGRIRITDFGLAGAAGEMLRAGTPAYMAPEQLAGGEVTPKSDIYALGLVLYELFTGRRALEGANLAELIAKREAGGITRPTELVRDLDPLIERAIMRCLDPDAARRPASALGVAAALPGGDPLAAALAAGETPSPEMVAAAGTTSALKPLPAIAGVLITLLLLAAVVKLSDRLLVTSVTPVPKPPMLLDERAKDILASLGYPRESPDSAHAFESNSDLVNYARTHAALTSPAALGAGHLPLLLFWLRTSPTEMVPEGLNSRVSRGDPPLSVSGMTRVVLDAQGRLTDLDVVPPQIDETVGGLAPNWKALFDAAGLDIAAFTATVPEWTPGEYADSRAAWMGPLPGVPDAQLRIEAGAYRGKPVFFHEVAPWTTASRMPDVLGKAAHVSIGSILGTLVIFSLFAAAGLIARHNVRKGRGDRRGALQMAVFVLAVAVIVGLISDKHVSNPGVEMTRFLAGQPLWAAGLLWLVYLALEPYVRRFWPATVVSWSRLMARQWRDPLVGRDILVGIGIGVLVRAIDVGHGAIVRAMGYGSPPRVPDLMQLLGARIVVAVVLTQLFNTLLNALFGVLALVLLKILVRRGWAVAAIAIGLPLVAGWSQITAQQGPVWLNVGAAVATLVLYVFTIQSLGLLATVMTFLVSYTLSDAVLTANPSHWFFSSSLLPTMVVAALACWGFYAARGGEPLLGTRLLD